MTSAEQTMDEAVRHVVLTPVPAPAGVDLGDALTLLTDAVRAIDLASVTFDGTPAQWCDLLGRVRMQRLLLAQVEASLEHSAARAFPHGQDTVEWEGGIAERRIGKDRKEWNHEAVTSAVTAAIVPPLAVDPNSGEVDRDLAALIHQGIEQYAATNRPAWRVTALKPLGVDPDEYCTAVRGRATVQVTLAGAES